MIASLAHARESQRFPTADAQKKGVKASAAVHENASRSETCANTVSSLTRGMVQMHHERSMFTKGAWCGPAC